MTQVDSRRPTCMGASEEDVRMMMNANSHVGAKVVSKLMEPYCLGIRADGTTTIDLFYTYEKLLVAARVMATIKNPKDICCVATRTYGHRALHKMVEYLGVSANVGRFIPGTFTNHIISHFKEPRLVVAMDSMADHQAIKEASMTNIPVIAFCNLDSPLQNVDVAIPINNRGRVSSGLMYYLLTREVLKLRGVISGIGWDVIPDMFIYRDLEVESESENEEETEKGFVDESMAVLEDKAEVVNLWRKEEKVSE